MLLLVISFVAGALTALAPCVLPLLPVIVGGSVASRSTRRAIIIAGSLALSVVAFTLALKATTSLLAVPPYVWSVISALFVGVVGISYALPELWNRLPLARFAAGAQRGLGRGARMQGIWGDVATGAALGPVFSSCSPTYFLILAAVLPASFVLGTAYLLSYALGLALVLLGIGVLGQRFASRLGWLADPQGRMRRLIGVLLILVALAVGFGFDKKLQTHLAGLPVFSALERFEQGLLQGALDDDGSRDEGGTGETGRQERYKEIADPAGFVNADGPVTIGEHVGKKVVLIDFMTYSCINCQRTFPHLVAWEERYRDAGLVVIGIHTPEFAFERVRENVARELGKFGITFPVVLDNDYATWRAYENNFWPRKYLIDIDGDIAYDHIGEGAYEETEQAIRIALLERSARLGLPAALPAMVEEPAAGESGSARATPETYLGSARSRGTVPLPSACPDASCASLPLHGVAVSEGFAQERESLTLTAATGEMAVRFTGNAVRLVAQAPEGGKLVATIDGVALPAVTVNEARLYELASGLGAGEHVLRLSVAGPGTEMFALTFSGPAPAKAS